MSDKEKIERLAKAMGCEIVGYNLVKDDELILGYWDPWSDPADLLPVLEHIESDQTIMHAFIEKINAMTEKSATVKGVRLAIMTPHIIADAALAVLEKK